MFDLEEILICKQVSAHDNFNYTVIFRIGVVAEQVGVEAEIILLIENSNRLIVNEFASAKNCWMEIRLRVSRSLG